MENISDEEMIMLLRESSSSIDTLYLKHVDYCMNFMNRMNFNEHLNKDVYHDAIIVFYEKVVNDSEIKLTCSIQTYLNSICRNQILVRLKKEGKSSDYSEGSDIRIDEWFEDDEIENQTRQQAVSSALNQLKEFGGKCYEILKRYFYDNNSMEKIAYELDYSNADNVKNQKARCQKRLKEYVFEILNKK